MSDPFDGYFAPPRSEISRLREELSEYKAREAMDLDRLETVVKERDEARRELAEVRANRQQIVENWSAEKQAREAAETRLASLEGAAREAAKQDDVCYCDHTNGTCSSCILREALRALPAPPTAPDHSVECLAAHDQGCICKPPAPEEKP